MKGDAALGAAQRFVVTALSSIAELSQVSSSKGPGATELTQLVSIVASLATSARAQVQAALETAPDAGTLAQVSTLLSTVIAAAGLLPTSSPQTTESSAASPSPQQPDVPCDGVQQKTSAATATNDSRQHAESANGHAEEPPHGGEGVAEPSNLDASAAEAPAAVQDTNGEASAAMPNGATGAEASSDAIEDADWDDSDWNDFDGAAESSRGPVDVLADQNAKQAPADVFEQTRTQCLQVSSVLIQVSCRPSLSER